MSTGDGPIKDLAHRLAPVGRFCRRAGRAATGPRARQGLKIAGGAVAVIALVGAVLVGLDKLGFDGSTGLEAITFGGGSSGDQAEPRSQPRQSCPACGGRGIVQPGNLDCPECLGTGFVLA